MYSIFIVFQTQMVLKTHKTKGLAPIIFQKKVKAVKNVTKTGTASLIHPEHKSKYQIGLFPKWPVQMHKRYWVGHCQKCKNEPKPVPTV